MIVAASNDDEEIDFFRQFEEIKLKKEQLTNRKDSADMNNLYESSFDSNDSKTASKLMTSFDHNNNNKNKNQQSSSNKNDEMNIFTPPLTGEERSFSATSSDQDSDSDDSDEPKKIFVHIKPMTGRSTPQAAPTDRELNLIGMFLLYAVYLLNIT